MPANHDPIVDTLRISDKALRGLLDSLDAAADAAAVSEHRRNQRITYHCRQGLVVRMHHPGGSVANYLVQPRNLSRTGLGFLHGSFVYPQTPCAITLPSQTGPTIRAEGRIVRCRHVSGNVHEVGLRFNEPIELDRVVPIGRYAADGAPAAEPRLTGHAVYLDDNVDDRDYLHFMLETIGLTSHPVDSVQQAVALVRQNQCHVMFADPQLTGHDAGRELVAVLRRAGYEGAVIAVMADDSDQASEQVIELGYTGVLIKPFTQDTLENLLRNCLGGPDDQTDDEAPLFSEQWSNERLRPLILGFLSRLEAQVDIILDRIDTEPGPELLKACLELKGTAGNLGYPSISTAAQELHRMCIEQADATRVREQADELSRLAMAAVRVRDGIDR